MTLKERIEGFALVGKNAKQIETLKKGSSKIDKVAAYLLSGRPVTGAILVQRFNVYSYRDIIYRLSKRGYTISRKVVKENDIDHTIWWLSDFSEGFVMARIEKPWD